MSETKTAKPRSRSHVGRRVLLWMLLGGPVAVILFGFLLLAVGYETPDPNSSAAIGNLKVNSGSEPPDWTLLPVKPAIYFGPQDRRSWAMNDLMRLLGICDFTKSTQPVHDVRVHWLQAPQDDRKRRSAWNWDHEVRVAADVEVFGTAYFMIGAGSHPGIYLANRSAQILCATDETFIPLAFAPL